MSGGYFENNQFFIREIIRSVQDLIKHNEAPNEYGEANQFSPAVIDKFKEACTCLEHAETYTHAMDLLVSGDTGESTFFKSLETLKSSLQPEGNAVEKALKLVIADAMLDCPAGRDTDFCPIENKCDENCGKEGYQEVDCSVRYYLLKSSKI